MDFKVAGTAEGITGFQMDIKIAGVSPEIMQKALAQAKRGRLHILSVMNETIDRPAPKISDLAPKVLSLKIETDKIGALIGTGGKTIKALCEQFNVKIDTATDGMVTIFARNTHDAEAAKKSVATIVSDPEVGTIYQGTVRRIMDFGAFVEIIPGKEGLVHISKLSKQRVSSAAEVLKEGQVIPVKLLEIDKLGRLNLSYLDAVDPEWVAQNRAREPERPRYSVGKTPRRDEYPTHR
jgi:polyribonucleotide nucleotidyltransferase